MLRTVGEGNLCGGPPAPMLLPVSEPWEGRETGGLLVLLLRVIERNM